ncbi:MAG: ArsB/NhaD family transporter, partial [Selenomonadaceae bacterium]|nr:ArsB/NhaD family transporter [Selenomonadaceae bacterium]
TFNIAAQLKVDVKPFLMAQIISSNIGGTATLIGDPPNIMIGSAVGLSFGDFILNMTAVSVLIFVVTVGLLVLIYKNDLHTKPELQDKVMRLNEHEQITDHILLKKCLFVLAITISLFAFHGMLGLESATAALTGASLLLLLTFHRNEEMIAKMLSKVEWLAIFFFGGLFILVGALVETGVIKMLAEEAIKVTQGDVTLTAMIILWMSAIASAFIDNIPFVATMIPLIKDMGQMGLTNLDPMWWSLALGACLGGNGTLIGASANVVVASMAAQRGRAISFIGFMKVAFPLMILSIIISTAYVWLRYL